MNLVHHDDHDGDDDNDNYNDDDKKLVSTLYQTFFYEAGREEFKIPMFKIPTFIIPMVQNTNEALSKYHLKVHNTNKLKRVKFLQFKIPTGWYYEHSVHNTNYNCGHG